MSSISVGLNAATGKTLEGWPHVVQSLNEIFHTRFGDRVVREWFGSFVPALLGRQLNDQEVPPILIAFASAVDQFEPRFRIKKITIVKASRDGTLGVRLQGDYMPNALIGDFTVARPEEITVS